MSFFTTAVTGLKTVVTAIGAGVRVWGVSTFWKVTVTTILEQSHSGSST